jgi:hypothetical protein
MRGNRILFSVLLLASCLAAGKTSEPIVRFVNLKKSKHEEGQEIKLKAYYQVIAQKPRIGMSAPKVVRQSALPGKEVDFVYRNPTGGTLQRVEVAYPKGQTSLVIDKPKAGIEYRIDYKNKEFTERKLKD